MSTIVLAVVYLWGYNAIHLRIYHKGLKRIQWAKCILYKQDDLSSLPLRNHILKGQAQPHTSVTPLLRVWSQIGPKGLKHTSLA